MIPNIQKAVTGLLLLVVNLSVAFAGTPAPEGAHLYIISPKNGEALSGPVTVMFGLKGMGAYYSLRSQNCLKHSAK
ncbi:MAG: hypothetical protein JAY74_14475 [Candidatus Thiodiazotropha taylori]|nr:hypothetical protein [Candidatus Thiodiazotropha taylori]